MRRNGAAGMDVPLAVSMLHRSQDAEVAISEAVVKDMDPADSLREETKVSVMDWKEQAKPDSRISFEELVQLALQQEIAKVQDFAAWDQSLADSAPDEISRKEAQANADAQLESIDYIQETAATEGVISGIHCTYPEDLQAYRERLAPLLTDAEAYWSLQEQYLTGSLDTDGFLQGLDGLLP